MILLVFGGGLVMCGTGGIIHYREDIKPMIEEIKETESHQALKNEIEEELNK